MTPNPPPPAPVPTQTEALRERLTSHAMELRARARVFSWIPQLATDIEDAASALLAAETREQAHAERIKGYEMESHRLIAERLKADAQVTALRSFIETLNDRSLEDLKEGRSVGAFAGDIYDAPDDCETHVVVTRRELRAALSSQPEPRAAKEPCARCARWSATLGEGYWPHDLPRPEVVHRWQSEALRRDLAPRPAASAETTVPASKLRALSEEWKERSTPAETDADDATLRCAREVERLLGC